MLRVGARLSQESELLVALRRGARRALRAAHSAASAQAPAAAASAGPAQTVLSAPRLPEARGDAGAGGGPAAGGAPPPPRSPPPPPPRRAWTAAAALAITASLGGVYYFRKSLESEEPTPTPAVAGAEAGAGAAEGPLEPASGAAFPAHVEFLIAGGGTAALAALRSLRALRPDARVLLAAEERAPPYMRPPLSKELWRSAPAAALAAAPPHDLHFTQWNGKRRNLAYEPLSFFTPVEELWAEGEGEGAEGARRRGGAALARGWRVARLDAAARRAELSAPGHPPVTVSFDKMLIATGSEPVLLEGLRGVRAAGRGGALQGARDAARLAGALAGGARRVAVVGGGPRAAELAAALTDHLGAEGQVTALFREPAPLAQLLPQYLAAHAARLLRERGVQLQPDSEVVEGVASERGVELRVRRQGQDHTLNVDYVVELTGAAPATRVWAAAGLEADARGLLVSAELAARGAVWAAGDVACWQRPHEPRGAARSHDHAVASGRRAAENMAAAGPGELQLYTHRPMTWGELGPELGYEAVGELDATLRTVGVFSTDAVTPVAAPQEAVAAGSTPVAAANVVHAPLTVETPARPGGLPALAAASPAPGAADPAPEAGAAAESALSQRYSRGVVFYLRGRRVVGVLLWNLFNRAPIARQVLEVGEFDDLFEVAKLFTPHEE